MIRVALVFGTRPEAIKLAPVAHALRAHGGFVVTTISSGQHRDMVGPVCKLFDLAIDHDLGVMKQGQTLSYLTGAVTDGLARNFAETPPDLVIVQGDTTTAFAGALAAFYHKLPVAHVEAGLRTGDLYSPWPEEANRVLISRIAAYHYPPTPGAAANLQAEGIAKTAMLTTGNTVIDAAHWIAARQSTATRAALAERLGLSAEGFVLFTMHRRESFGAGVDRIFHALDRFARVHDVEVLFPVHPNPHVSGPAKAILGRNHRIRLVTPLDYAEMVFALAACRFVITDSGGLVEEASSFGKPALVLRETTERRESIDAGGALLIGTDADALLQYGGELITGGALHAAMSSAPNPFGDGRAAIRIANHLAQVFDYATTRVAA